MGISSPSTSLWIFGYGSLCWNPGFEHRRSAIGYIQGFSRRFWQGNITHRGISGRPGRVATLVEDTDSRSYGVAYELTGEDALKYLETREVTLGGYDSRFTTFYPSLTNEPFPVLLYIATPSNEHWLGPTKEDQIAEEVVKSRGNSGHNVEYVIRLADWSRLVFPHVLDPHLFSIEKSIRILLDERGLGLRSLMGGKDKCYDYEKGIIPNSSSSSSEDSRDIREDRMPPMESSSFASNVKFGGMRCVRP